MQKAKYIQGFPDYIICTSGDVWTTKWRNAHRLRRLKPDKGLRGYLRVTLSKNNMTTRRRVHSLILETFTGSRPQGMECRHKDGNKVNNNLENLCWGTRSENMRDAVIHGTHPATKLTMGQTVEIYNNRNIQTSILAKQYSVHPCTIRRIKNRKRWYLCTT